MDLRLSFCPKCQRVGQVVIKPGKGIGHTSQCMTSLRRCLCGEEWDIKQEQDQLRLNFHEKV